MCSGKAASVNQYRNNGCGQVLYNNDTVPGRPLGIFYIRRIEMKKIIALIAAVTFLSIGFGNMAIAKNKCGNGNGNQEPTSGGQWGYTWTWARACRKRR